MVKAAGAKVIEAEAAPVVSVALAAAPEAPEASAALAAPEEEVAVKERQESKRKLLQKHQCNELLLGHFLTH